MAGVVFPPPETECIDTSYQTGGTDRDLPIAEGDIQLLSALSPAPASEPIHTDGESGSAGFECPASIVIVVKVFFV